MSESNADGQFQRGSQPAGSNSASAPVSPSRWPLFALMAAAIIIPAWFWYLTYFGTPLSDERIEKILQDAFKEEKLRPVQHAFEQISRRMQSDPQGVRKFYPLLLPLTEHPEVKIRINLAWLLGEDNQEDDFRAALHKLIVDPEPLVRYNAALALARFQDPKALPVLHDMLEPFTVNAETDGVVREMLEAGKFAQHEAQLLRLKVRSEDELFRQLSPLNGKVLEHFVEKDSEIRRGDPVCRISPPEEQVFMALKAFWVLGRPEDIGVLENFSKGGGSISSARIREQALNAIESIRERQKTGTTGKNNHE